MDIIKKFLDQDDEKEAFIYGPAGSGKTTYIKKIVSYLEQNNIPYIITAYTHKAKEVIQKKLGSDKPIATLHSFLKKRPHINEEAKTLAQLQILLQKGKPIRPKVLIVDEFSFINEQDYITIQELEDYWCKNCKENTYGLEVCDECGTKAIAPIKVIFVGDNNQLPPVKGFNAIEPYGSFQVKLTKVYRNNFPQLKKLVDMIEGNCELARLEESSNFLRGRNIDKEYKNDTNSSKLMLAYTNYAVQHHNAKIQGRSKPKVGDTIYFSSLRLNAKINKITKTYHNNVITQCGEINPDTKYNPLKYLNSLNEVQFFHTDIGVIPAIFGSYNNKVIREDIANSLIVANRKNNKALSSKLYRKYKNINDYVSIADFTYCITVHKAQGQEFDNIYIDIKDFTKCLDKTMQLKLLYVAMSRAKKKIILNA